MFFGRPVSKNSDCLSLPLSPLPPLAASSRAMTLREVVVTDVTAARESLLPNVQGLDGGQRNLLRLGFLTTGSCVCAHTCNWAVLGTAASPAQYTRWQSYSSQEEEEEKKKRKKMLFFSQMNANPITYLGTHCLCHRVVVNNTVCSLRPAVLCVHGWSVGEILRRGLAVFLLDHHL